MVHSLFSHEVKTKSSFFFSCCHSLIHCGLKTWFVPMFAMCLTGLLGVASQNAPLNLYHRRKEKRSTFPVGQNIIWRICCRIRVASVLMELWHTVVSDVYRTQSGVKTKKELKTCMTRFLSAMNCATVLNDAKHHFCFKSGQNFQNGVSWELAAPYIRQNALHVVRYQRQKLSLDADRTPISSQV